MKYTHVMLLAFFFCCALPTEAQNVTGGVFYSSSFTIDELPRSCSFYFPANMKTEKIYPLIIFLHDQNSASKTFIQQFASVITARTDTAGYILVFPDAIYNRWHLRKNSVEKDSVNDVGYLSILLDYFTRQYNADADRIFVAGINNGADMAACLQCALPAQIKAAIKGYTAGTKEMYTCANTSINTNKKQIAPDKNAQKQFLLSAFDYFNSFKQ